MSAVTNTPQRRPVPPVAHGVGRVTFSNVLRSEWTKLVSLRSTRWTLLAAFVALAGLGPLIAAIQMGRWNQLSVGEQHRFDSVAVGIGGYVLGQLAIAVLGVLVVSGEYSTGMIRSSMMAVPRRLPVLWAKLAVFATVTLALTLVGVAISFFAVQAIVASHHVQHAIGDPGVLRSVIGAALYMTVLGALCLGLGGIVRNTAAGISIWVFLLFVLPGINAILPSSISNSVEPYLPLNAGTTVATFRFDNSHHLSAWGGFALFCAYAVAALVGAAITLIRRDV